MSLTSTDIRHAYQLIHKLPSIAELEKLGMLDAKLFPAEDLELDIDAFMIKHGFKEVDKADGEAERLKAEQEAAKAEAEAMAQEQARQEASILKSKQDPKPAKRAYTKKAKLSHK